MGLRDVCAGAVLLTRLAAYSGAADIALALFPWFIIWASTISRKERLGVVISMSMGVL